jgi:hypothetical protein
LLFTIKVKDNLKAVTRVPWFVYMGILRSNDSYI